MTLLNHRACHSDLDLTSAAGDYSQDPLGLDLPLMASLSSCWRSSQPRVRTNA
jgi:hypothetical protein